MNESLALGVWNEGNSGCKRLIYLGKGAKEWESGESVLKALRREVDLAI